jgi:hypothetical protein
MNTVRLSLAILCNKRVKEAEQSISTASLFP